MDQIIFLYVQTIIQEDRFPRYSPGTHNLYRIFVLWCCQTYIRSEQSDQTFSVEKLGSSVGSSWKSRPQNLLFWFRYLSLFSVNAWKWNSDFPLSCIPVAVAGAIYWILSIHLTENIISYRPHSSTRDHLFSVVYSGRPVSDLCNTLSFFWNRLS